MIEEGDHVEFRLYKHPTAEVLKGIVIEAPDDASPYWEIKTSKHEYNFKEYCWIRKITAETRKAHWNLGCGCNHRCYCHE